MSISFPGQNSLSPPTPPPNSAVQRSFESCRGWTAYPQISEHAVTELLVSKRVLGSLVLKLCPKCFLRTVEAAAGWLALTPSRHSSPAALKPSRVRGEPSAQGISPVETEGACRPSVRHRPLLSVPGLRYQYAAAVILLFVVDLCLSCPFFTTFLVVFSRV